MVQVGDRKVLAETRRRSTVGYRLPREIAGSLPRPMTESNVSNIEGLGCWQRIAN